MPALLKCEAAEKLAQVVEKAKPSLLVEIEAELFPEKPATKPPVARDLAETIRTSLAVEEIVDLWNVIFPEDNNVWYDEESNTIHYNEELVGNSD